MSKATEIAKNVAAVPIGIAVGAAAVTVVVVGIPIVMAWGLGRAILDLPSQIRKMKEDENVIDAEKVKP